MWGKIESAVRARDMVARKKKGRHLVAPPLRAEFRQPLSGALAADKSKTGKTYTEQRLTDFTVKQC